MTKFVVVVGLCLLMAFGQLASVSAVTEAPQVEQSTESPIADMALIEVAPMAPKMPMEKPPVVQEAPMTQMAAMPAMPAMVAMPSMEGQEKSAPVAAQPHTVADFIIHPLIAFKPRQASLEEIHGKQAAATPGSNTPASSGTWLFGMNPAQQLGSSFSTLAGSVSGWFNDRLQAAGQQLPGLVETPVRESTTSTSSTTSTTTQRPDVVVRVQQRPLRNGNRLGNRNGNLNNNNNKRRQRPNRFNNRLDSFEDDYYEDDYFQGNRFDDEFDDDEEDQSLDQFEDDDSLEMRPQQKPKRKQAQVQQQRRKFQQEDQQVVVNQKRRQPVSQTKKSKGQKKPAQPVVEESQDDEELEDDENENDDDEEEVQEDDSQEQDFQPEEPAVGSSSTKRSQNQPNFIQRGQQSIISQLRQFTRGQTPGELATTLRRTPASSGSSKTRRPQQTTLLVSRNGQTVYLAPELLNLNSPYPYSYVQGQNKKQRVSSGPFPQPPLTMPVRRQGRPTQYITIPWSQLGLSPPDQQSMVSLAEGIQSQPLILNIPQSAINPVRSTNGQKKKRPQLTASAVPLLADASLMDIFQPPQIPPSRTGTPSSAGSSMKPISAQPVLIAAKPVKAGSMGGTRIRPGTIVEKAPAMEAPMEKPMEATEVKQEQEMMGAEPASAPQMAASSPEQQEFILVGDDSEPGVSRHVQPAFGDARYVPYGDFHPYFDLLTQNRRFALRKTGRSLENPEEQVAPEMEMEAQKEEHVQMEEMNKEEIMMEEPKMEESMMEEPKMEESMMEEPKMEESKMEEPKMEEPKMEEPQMKENKMEEPQMKESMMEEPKMEEPKMEEPQMKENKMEEPQMKESMMEEPQMEESKMEEPQMKESMMEEPQMKEPQKEELKEEESKMEKPQPMEQSKLPA